MELYPADIVIHIINIVILYVLLRLLVYKPVRKFMLAREERVRQQLEDAAEKQAEADKAREEYDARLSTADAEVQRKLQAGEHRAMEAYDAVLEHAREESDRIVREGQARAAEEAQGVLSGMSDMILGAAVDMAGKVLSREISIEDNREIAEQFFDGKGEEDA